MRQTFTIFLTFFCVTQFAAAQPLPDLKIFTTRFIPLETPANTERIEIAKGHFLEDVPFSTNVIVRKPVTRQPTIVEVPEFNGHYTWRTVSKSGSKSTFQYFNVGTTKAVDTHYTRLIVTHPATQFADGYVACDAPRAIYDMAGRAIWYMPVIPGKIEPEVMIRDLKISPFNTLTFIYNNEQVYEMTWDGRILWEGPDDGKVSGEASERYHHEFTRLSNGNYMVMGNESICLGGKPPHRPAIKLGPDGKPLKHATGDTACYFFNTLIEYDKTGKVVWSWHSFGYFDTALLHKNYSRGPVNTHANAFYFDEKKKNIYVSFKNGSEILKVKYPTGKVVAAYGKGYKFIDTDDTTKALFCDQHSVKLSSKGELYMFNNNMCNPGKDPALLVCKEPTIGRSLIPIWSYTCPVNWSRETEHKRTSSSGGCVQQLDEKSFFICLCSPQAGMLIVNRNNQKLWEGYLETRGSDDQLYPAGLYRASYIPRASIEHFLLNRSPIKHNVAR